MGATERSNVTEGGQRDGQPMLFAHGFGCDQHMWFKVAPRFEDRYRVLSYDLAGYGGSDMAAYDPERHGSLHGYAADLVDIIEELDLTDLVFVGHSVSAMIGALAARAVPERFARLVMVGPSRATSTMRTTWEGSPNPISPTSSVRCRKTIWAGRAPWPR